MNVCTYNKPPLTCESATVQSPCAADRPTYWPVAAADAAVARCYCRYYYSAAVAVEQPIAVFAVVGDVDEGAWIGC